MGYTEKHELWKKRVKDRKLLRELLEMNEDQIIIRLDLEDEQAIREWEEQEEILSLKRMKITTESEQNIC